jgi:hypothetical protein
MLIRCIYLGISFFIVFACSQSSNSSIILEQAEPQDSLIFAAFQSESEINSLISLNDTTIMSKSSFSEAYLYKKRLGIFQLDKTILIQGVEGDISFLQRINETFYFFGRHTVCELDSHLKVTKTYTLYGEAPYLKSHYFLPSCEVDQACIINDTLICRITHNHINFMKQTFKEKLKGVFKLSHDSAILIKTIIDSPKNLVESDYFSTTNFLKGTTFYFLYPSRDSLYTYDLKTKQAKTLPINNADFKTPPKKLKDKENDSAYETQFYFSNYLYEAVVYNPNTNHLVAFYSAPKELKEGENATDKYIRAVVLDTNGHILKYVNFKHYYIPYCATLIKNKGIAIPINHDDLTNEKTIFHIFNL